MLRHLRQPKLEERYYIYRGFRFHFYQGANRCWYADLWDEYRDCEHDGNRNGLRLAELIDEEKNGVDMIWDEWEPSDHRYRGATMQPTAIWKRLPRRFKTLKPGSPVHKLTPEEYDILRNGGHIHE